jgi:deoxyribonuclease V
MFPRRERVPTEQLKAWRERQRELAAEAVRRGSLTKVKVVAGVDCAFDGDDIHAVAVVWGIAGQKALRIRQVRRRVEVPYVTGFLSFREGPAVHEALDAAGDVDVILIDGQGVAHPRGCGLATHIGVERNVPTVGCAKSRLCGDFDEPGPMTGDASDLVLRDEVVGRVVRTRVKTKPLFVSVGHRCSLESAVDLVLRCRTKLRLPEPTRLADQLVTRAKRGEDVTVEP